ncbi:hypothetical protein AMK17_28395 [Streptomyces sp. CB00072]|nr:hypothetical protein AMK17_28395 [Streptomyces sp. CB00072]
MSFQGGGLSWQVTHMPSERGMQYPASARQLGQVRRARIAAASAAARAGVMGRTGLARSTR